MAAGPGLGTDRDAHACAAPRPRGWWRRSCLGPQETWDRLHGAEGAGTVTRWRIGCVSSCSPALAWAWAAGGPGGQQAHTRRPSTQEGVGLGPFSGSHSLSCRCALLPSLAGLWSCSPGFSPSLGSRRMGTTRQKEITRPTRHQQGTRGLQHPPAAPAGTGADVGPRSAYHPGPLQALPHLGPGARVAPGPGRGETEKPRPRPGPTAHPARRSAAG